MIKNRFAATVAKKGKQNENCTRANYSQAGQEQNRQEKR